LVYLVISDIHGNLEALDACLADARHRGFDASLVLGDLVGYGADPNTVIARILGLAPRAIVRGNHDKVAAGIEQPEGFNAVAKAAVEWTRETLTPESRAWLAALPQGPIVIDDLIEICHGTPFDEDAYVFDEVDASRALAVATRPLCLYGHTHNPAVFVLEGQMLDRISAGEGMVSRITLKPHAKYLVNAGAVGQPRDGNPRAAYALVDTEARAIDLVRVDYDIRAAQTKVIDAGLPELLARRLTAGR
jgi:diadenosine tetraphosphatase ApaH/serine/threonine PP2A family protein phosphatase